MKTLPRICSGAWSLAGVHTVIASPCCHSAASSLRRRYHILAQKIKVWWKPTVTVTVVRNAQLTTPSIYSQKFHYTGCMISVGSWSRSGLSEGYTCRIWRSVLSMGHYSQAESISIICGSQLQCLTQSVRINLCLNFGSFHFFPLKSLHLCHYNSAAYLSISVKLHEDM